jgi:pyruvate dehydrogenase E1 component alpha subunit/2-oxoisovalerate dehydrogenase E1 component alpha subunit
MNYPLTKEQRIELYYYMRLNRMLEEQMVRLFRQNKIVGGLYSSLGQEAISVGTAYALEKRDWLAPMIRNIGALLVKGFKPRDIFTQHMAKYTAPTLGKDGTSHFGDLDELHVVSPISMLGDLIPVMTGVAMAGRYLGQSIVALTWIGDGGSSTGAFHEGMNLAASQRAPLVLVIENNQWAYSTPVGRQVPVGDLADRAKAYGVPGLIVDGNDVTAVYQTTKDAVARCRAGEGPVIIEAKTHRMRGHAQHDAAEYVPKEMKAFWEKRDPIERYEKQLMAEGLLDAKSKAAMEARIEKELDEEREFAESSPLPPPELAEEGVYCDGCHEIAPKWQRPIEDVMPPKASVKAEWLSDPLSGLEDSVREASTSVTAAAGDGNAPAATVAKNGKKPKAGARAAVKTGRGRR